MPGGGPQKDTPKPRKTKRPRWYKAFLMWLVETGNVSTAASSVGIARKTAYRHRERNPSFAAEWEDALEEACDRLEAEARRRALQGWEEPVFRKSEQVGVIRRYSDRLMIELLRAHRPERFRYQRIEGTGSTRESHIASTLVTTDPHGNPAHIHRFMAPGLPQALPTLISIPCNHRDNDCQCEENADDTRRNGQSR